MLDDCLLGSANRVSFLLGALADLRAALGGALVVRRGEPAAIVASLRPSAIYMARDWSADARERECRLREVAEVRLVPGAAVVEPGAVAPAGRDHYRVFTPYWRVWQGFDRRAIADEPRRVALPRGVAAGQLPALRSLVSRTPSPRLPPGGETAGRRRLERFLASGLAAHANDRDRVDRDVTSRLSPYLRFGCVSPLDLARLVDGRLGGEDVLRRLCWRDFSLQLLAAFPRLPVDEFRPRGRKWQSDHDAVAAWRAGRTGIPIVDAGMRQLLAEGWLPNRVRLLAASLLTKDLGIDWRLGAAHFLELLVDGDPASNSTNWQWVAGTGTDTRPNRTFNPVRQARRIDPQGDYVRRYVPELRTLDGPDVHEPWKRGRSALEELGYPLPLVEVARGPTRRRASAKPKIPAH